MIHRVFVLFMIAAVIANQAMAYACHVHNETDESNSRPHIHVGLTGHSHGSGHEHSHRHSGAHTHVGDNDCDITKLHFGECPAHDHDSDVVYIADSDVIVQHRIEPPEPSPIEVCDTSSFWSSKAALKSHVSFRRDANCPFAPAHLLKKIRLQL